MTQPTPPHGETATVGPRCGNNPNARLADGDRKAIAEFKAYLADRAASSSTASAASTPCSVPDPCADGELCDRHETEQAHAEGEHELCGVTCEVQFPTEALRNFILAKGYPGTKGALDELLRRASLGTGTTPAARPQVVQRHGPGVLTPHDARQRAEQSLREVLGIVADWCREANNIGGVDAGDLAWRLEQAGHLLPDEDGDSR